MQESKTMHYILGAALVLIAVFVIAALVMINSQAENVGTEVTITNQDSTVDSVGLFTQIDGGGTELTGAWEVISDTADNLYVYALINDANGEDDIMEVDAYVHIDGVPCTNATGTEKLNDCQKLETECTVLTSDPGSDVDVASVNCPISFPFYTESSMTGGRYPTENWTIDLRVKDSMDNWVLHEDEMSFDIVLDLAVNADTSAINWGTQSLGYTSAAGANRQIVYTQAGNDQADFEVYGGALACSGYGSIPLANQSWSVDAAADYGSGTTLTDTWVETDIDITYDEEGAGSSETLFWQIGVPSTGLAGMCSGITYTNMISM